MEGKPGIGGQEAVKTVSQLPKELRRRGEKRTAGRITFRGDLSGGQGHGSRRCC